MHSKFGLEKAYPGLDKALPFYYGYVSSIWYQLTVQHIFFVFRQEDKHHNEYKFINWTWLNSLNMMDVMKVFFLFSLPNVTILFVTLGYF